MSNNLLLFANDAASANMTIAYAYLYKKHYKKILAYPCGTAVQLYEEHIKSYISKGEIEFSTNDTIVTGTSGIDSSYELNAIKKAKQSKVLKTIMIVDNTKNFNMRFTINKQIVKKADIPDEIWVFEKKIFSGIEYLDNKIRYKRNIYGIFLRKLFKKNKPIITNTFIEEYKNKYLVILTEYLYELYRLKYGFTEYDMIEVLLESIDQSRINIPIFLKLHPREHKNKFNIILRKYSHLNIVQDECNIQELIYYSKVVCGINSSVFQECTLFNKPTFSIQTNSKVSMNLSYLDQKYILTNKSQINDILKNYF